MYYQDMLQKNKERYKVEVMNSSIQSSICISEVLTCLMSIGVKRNMLSLQKLNRKKGRAFKISHCL